MLRVMQVFIVIVCFITIINGGRPRRPNEIVEMENQCSAEHTGFLQNVQEKAAGFLTKIKLGIVSLPEKNDDNNGASEKRPKMCEYYQCILQKLKMINEYDLPDLGMAEKALSKYMDDSSRRVLDRCFNNLINDLSPYEDNVPEPVLTEINGLNEEILINFEKLHDNSKINPQVACETSASLYKCLATDTQKCPVFVYP